MNEYTFIVVRSFVMSVVFTVVLTKTAAGRELVYELGFKMLKWYTGFTRFTKMQIGDTFVQSVGFRDGSRYCIERNADGSISEYTTGKMAKIYSRCRKNLNTLIR